MNMKKKIIRRGLLGIPLGMALGDVITITSSLIWGQGEYVPCIPYFVEMIGSESCAVALQAVLCAVIGAAFAMASVIWEIDHWSIAKQTGLYFIITASVMMPVAYIAGWMERSVEGAVIYFLIFVCFFAAVWLSQYAVMRYKIGKMNRNLLDKKEKI